MCGVDVGSGAWTIYYNSPPSLLDPHDIISRHDEPAPVTNIYLITSSHLSHIKYSTLTILGVVAKAHNVLNYEHSSYWI